MWAREVGNKQNKSEDTKEAIRDTTRLVKDTFKENKVIITMYNQKVKDTKSL